MENVFGNLTAFIFVLIRVTGFMMFNPILSRKNVPTIIRAGMIMILSVFFVSFNQLPIVEVRGYFDFALIAAKELFVGYVAGFIVNIFLSVVVLGGEIIDYQLGLTMGKMYDPVNAAQLSITSALLNTMLIIFFFQSGSYLTLIKIFANSYEIIPIGFEIFSNDIVIHIVGLFSNMYVLAIKISIPVIAAHIITEMGVGILMKAVPQINVFVVNMQLKIAVGGIVFFVVLTPISRFLDGMLNMMMGSIQTALKLMG
ncbi:MAG: flagellar biosynthetic protein FliR [Oscillospiraceae bacterium]